MTEDSGFQVLGNAPASYERHVHVFMAPLVDAMLERVGPAEGASVLDVACGTGLVALGAAARVGPSGRVAGADINPEMLEIARKRGAELAPSITWHAASADDLPFDDDAFDFVLAQQGIQFFPDLHTAVAEFARVTAPGGLVAATSWTPLPSSPYFEAQYHALTETLGTQATATFAEAFRLTSDDLRAAWAGAGLRDVTVDALSVEVTLPPMRDYVAAHLDATPWGPVLRAADKAAQRATIEKIEELLADHSSADGTVTVPFGTWLTVGRR